MKRLTILFFLYISVWGVNNTINAQDDVTATPETEETDSASLLDS